MTGAAVVLYVARGCHLCAQAREVLAELQPQLEFALEEIDVTGNPELEERYRELLPVVEIGGRRVFAYFVPPQAFRQAYATAQAGVRNPAL